MFLFANWTKQKEVEFYTAKVKDKTKNEQNTGISLVSSILEVSNQSKALI